MVKNRGLNRIIMRQFQKCVGLSVAVLFMLEAEASVGHMAQGLRQDTHMRTVAIPFDDLPGAVPGTDHGKGTLCTSSCRLRRTVRNGKS